MKHTKAPWAINTERHEGKADKILVYSKVNSLRVATCYNENKSIFPDKQTCLANAKLIAAAPEMLDFLIGVSKLNQSAREHINEHFFIELELIIKKATE